MTVADQVSSVPRTARRLQVRVVGRQRWSDADVQQRTGAGARARPWAIAVIPIALGGLLIAFGYAAGRAHAPNAEAQALYWAGQGLIWLPSIATLLSTRTDNATRIAVITAVAGAQALLTWAYSPDQFRFTDEFQHIRTLSDILRTHHLFTPNSFLPVSPAFPGLEIVTAALMQTTGLPLFTAGVIVDSVTHVLLPLFVFLGFRELTANARTSSVAALLYLTAPHLGYLEVLFIYSTPALLYYAIALRTTVRVARSRSPMWTLILPFVPMTLSHHLTTLAGLVMLIAMVVVLALAGRGRQARRLGLMTAGIAAGVIAWILILAPETFAYLAAPATAAVQSLLHPGAGAATTAVTTVGAAPRWETLTAVVAALLLLGASTLGAVITWWSHAGRVSSLVALLGLVYPAVLVGRTVIPGGPTLAARVLTYAMLFIAYPAAVALTTLWDQRRRPFRRRLAWAITGVLAVGGIVTGLPPWYERIPGVYHVAGFESGIDERAINVGHWAASWRPGARVVCGVSVCDTIGGYSRATISTAGSQIFYAGTERSLNSAIADQVLNYVETDVRWTRQVPLSGSYWTSDTANHTHPLPAAVLTRVNRDPYADLVYDDGLIRVYNTTLVWSN
ncbi:hypothetical protein [Conexibacter sp. DBS9H8]|uniref:hypothetical protein n=1 Tax=Conexibacter sp. DBS9H8 TaxID=2937801 RepID=UPI00200BF62F|nr:hypothetical protein [Conexibacter sp. DBS9H8]